tara:strand:- start:6965 stop:7579 length:615 start_codon:yes stop_codon:yes gene_type:complete
MHLIPNTIIQIFLGENESITKHILFQTNRLLWRQYAEQKGFRYIFLTKDNIAEYLGDHKDFYYSMRFTWNRIDFIRYLVLNKIGGFYIDLDIEPNFDRDLFQLSKEPLILNKWFCPKKQAYELNNALMACRPGFFTDLIKFSISQYNEKKNIEVYAIRKIRFMLHTTGVRMFKKWCKVNGYTYTPEIHEYVTDGCTATWLKNFN